MIGNHGTIHIDSLPDAHLPHWDIITLFKTNAHAEFGSSGVNPKRAKTIVLPIHLWCHTLSTVKSSHLSTRIWDTVKSVSIRWATKSRIWRAGARTWIIPTAHAMQTFSQYLQWTQTTSCNVQKQSQNADLFEIPNIHLCAGYSAVSTTMRQVLDPTADKRVP